MATKMKAARKHAPRLASEGKARRRNAKKRPLHADTVHSDMPLWGRPGYLLRRLHQIHYALFFEECAGFDITPVQYGLLTTLSLNPDLDQNSLSRTRNRPHQCRRCPQPPCATRAPRAPPQPGRRTHGPCAIDPRRRATDAKDVSADATRPETSARAAPLAGARRAHHNSDPPHQRQQSSWPDDLSAQLRSNDRRRVSLDGPT